MSIPDLYTYAIKNIYVYDGDTITADIDLGFNMTFRAKIRLKDIDTPELRGEDRPQGLAVRNWLRARVSWATENEINIYVKTYKDKTGKYGRYLGYLYIGEENINETLVSENMAKPFML